MIGTDAESGRWWCHKTVRGALNSDGTPADRCIGPGCAAWRWLTDEFEMVKTGAYVRAVDGRPAKLPTIAEPKGDGWEAMGPVEQHPDTVERGGRPYIEFSRYWKRPRDYAQRLGFCGAVQNL